MMYYLGNQIKLLDFKKLLKVNFLMINKIKKIKYFECNKYIGNQNRIDLFFIIKLYIIYIYLSIYI